MSDYRCVGLFLLFCLFVSSFVCLIAVRVSFSALLIGFDCMCTFSISMGGFFTNFQWVSAQFPSDFNRKSFANHRTIFNQIFCTFQKFQSVFRQFCFGFGCRFWSFLRRQFYLTNLRPICELLGSSSVGQLRLKICPFFNQFLKLDFRPIFWWFCHQFFTALVNQLPTKLSAVYSRSEAAKNRPSATKVPERTLTALREHSNCTQTALDYINYINFNCFNRLKMNYTFTRVN